MPTPPKNPEGFDKVNYVIDSWVNACDAPWYIYIETLKPAALEALIVLVSFGWADVARGLLRPKGTGRRTSKRKGKWAKRIPAFPEVGNTIGKHLPFAEQVEDFTNWGTKGRYLWRIDNAMQAGLFMWLVYDVAEDFIFNWTSLLYETEWCKQSGNGRFSMQNTGWPLKSAGSWWKEGYNVRDYQYAPPGWMFNSGYTGSYPCTVAAAVAWERWGLTPPPTNCTLRIAHDATDFVFAQTEASDTDPDGTLTQTIAGTVPANTPFKVQTYHDGSWCHVGRGAVMAIALGPT